MSAPTPGQADEALRARNRDLEVWHMRDMLAVEVHKARADHQESRAKDAEERLACFAGHAERYRQLAELAATGQRDADLVEELRRRIAVLERHLTAAAGREPHAAPEPHPLSGLVANSYALYKFAQGGEWLTCEEDGRLDMRKELLAVKAAVREALKPVTEPQPAPELAKAETEQLP